MGNRIIDYDTLSRCVEYNHVTGEFVPYKGFKSKANVLSDMADISENASGYVTVTVKGRTYLAHRLAYFIYYGIWPGDYVVDHIDRNRKNNAISNLRLLNRRHNAINSNRYWRTGFEGVTYTITKKHGLRFYATVYGKVKEKVGPFKTREEAHEAYINLNDERGFNEHSRPIPNPIPRMYWSMFD